MAAFRSREKKKMPVDIWLVQNHVKAGPVSQGFLKQDDVPESQTDFVKPGDEVS